MSMESAYSRKSLSKLGLLKKLKNASDKIKKAFSRPNLKQEKDGTAEVVVPEKPKEKKKEHPVVAPVYIYIPLKDENADCEKSEAKNTDEVSTPEVDSPIPGPGKVELIILTAPSDDELLDYNSSDVAETPSSENKLFFGNKITELKELAKGAIDGLSTKEKQKLLTVDEEITTENAVPTKLENFPGNINEVQTDSIMDTTPADDKLADHDNTPPSENKLEDLASTQLILEKMETDSPIVVPETNNESTTLASQESEKDSSAVALEDSSSAISTLDPKPSIEGLKQPASVIREVNTLVDEEDGLSETTVAVIPKEPNDQKDIKILETPEAAKSLEASVAVILKESDDKKDTKKLETSEAAKSLEATVAVIPKESDDHKDTKILETSDAAISLEAKEDSKLELPTRSNSTEETKHPESPKLKKKVSFRKKAKLMGDGSYEDVEVPQGSFEGSDAGCIAAGESESEKLAVEAVSSPLEEDDNKWSKASDHEYEPVNPPPEDFVMIPCSTIVHTPTDGSPSPRQSPDHQEHPDHHEPARTPEPEADPEKRSGLHKFQSEFKRKAQDLKGRFHAMKKPHISLPARPVFHKPNFNIDRSKSAFQRVKSKFPSLKPKVKRHHSTESNDGDTKKTIFSTYPRIFKRKPSGYNDDTNPSDFATVPRSRTKKSGEPLRIPLHSEDSIESREDTYVRGESLEELPPSHFQYSEGGEEENGEEENGEEENGEEEFGSLGRWDRGTFTADRPDNVVTDLDMPEEHLGGQGDFKDHYSSGSSNGVHRQGVLEEIDSDEFFLRQKGISQDNIEVGMYLSSEIRDAFRTPVNALSQMQHQDYTLKGSSQSIPEVTAKRKPIKKPKRKKTPHVSQERIENYEEESAEDTEEGAIPPRPKRNSRRSRKPKRSQENIIPYQETISMEPHDRIFEHRESLAILGDDERDEEKNVYENDGVLGKEKPEISVTDYLEEQEPLVPPRKQKSLKSLNFSENDSILGQAYSEDVIPTLEAIRTESKIIIPIPAEVPERPKRSRSRSQINSQYPKEVHDENEDAFTKFADDKIPYADEPEPAFTKTTNEYRHYFNDPEPQFATQKSEVYFEKTTEPTFAKNNSEHQEPCVEEICKQDIRDCMGYAIIDKTKARDPPLPPPRIPKRRKKPLNNKFATVHGTNSKDKSPIRPLRNYSTLGQMRKPSPYGDENDENIDITQYLEIDDAAKKLQSGDVIQKMKDRPLPPPPRPPRKTRPLHDIASEENIMIRHNDLEAEVSTQTEPLPDDFVCEEMVEEPTDTVIIPTERRKKQAKPLPEEILWAGVIEEPAETVASIERRQREAQSPSDEFFCEEIIEKPTDNVMFPTERRKKQAKPLPEETVCDEVVEEPVETVASMGRRTKEAQSPSDDFFCEEIIEPTDTAIFPTERRKKQAKSLPEETVCEEVVEEPLETVPSIVRRKREVEPPSNDFFCEEIIEEPTNTVIIPTERRKKQAKPLPDNLVSVKVKETITPLMKEVSEEPTEAERSKREIHLTTPTVYTYEETVMHGSLLVEPLDGSNILPNQKERRIPVHVDSNDEETSSIPEEFNKLSTPPEEPITRKETIEHGVPKPQSLRNLDIDTLTVNRLMADKLVVSELDAGVVRTNEISSDSGNVQVTGLNLPPELIKEVIMAMKSDQAKSNDTTNEQSDQAKGNATTNEQSDQAKGNATTNGQSSGRKIEELAHSETEPIRLVEDVDGDNSKGPNIENEKTINEMSSPSESCGVGSVNEAIITSEEDSVPLAVEITGVTNEKLEIKDEANIPPRPPRQSEKNKSVPQREEPEVDDTPPPRPPQPQIAYVPSQPPASFYALKAERYLESVSDVPTVPRRKRHTKSKHPSRSSSDESSAAALPRRRSHRRSNSPSLGELSSTLLRVCGGEINCALKRLVTYVLSNVPRSDEGKQDISAMIMIVLVMIAGLILLGYGEEKTVVHLHHWDYFNPPTDM